MKICVVVPVYNEEKTIERNLKTIIQYAQELPATVMVVAVNDGSADHSGEAISGLAKAYAPDVFHAISYTINRGYGGAIKMGIDYAIAQNFDYVVFMDSDLTDHPKYLQSFYGKMIEDWDYIKTTRHASEGGYNNVPWIRRVISQVGCEIGKLLTGLPLTDLANGFRAVKVDILKQLKLKEEKFPIIMEELVKAKKVTNRFCEIPRIQGVRDPEARPSAFVYDFKTLWGYVKYLFIN